ncbi:excisionase family DNA-binding protein [Thalassobacillus hwangdonensis]|uniref:Excisionase family DNA-binding protein n=1 Tax=Thalassobacillus hwangdonensis TaxID=546108 RepID=A0ABW3L5W8_9BACI
MYLTIKETAAYLDVPEYYLEKLVMENKIRTIDDGNETLINKDQFKSYFDQVEKYRIMIQEYLNEPIPPDPDVKDED